MRRPASSVPLSLAVLADLTLAEGQREAAIELIDQAYAVADAAMEQRSTRGQLGSRALATPVSPMAMEAAA